MNWYCYSVQKKSIFSIPASVIRIWIVFFYCYYLECFWEQAGGPVYPRDCVLIIAECLRSKNYTAILSLTLPFENCVTDVSKILCVTGFPLLGASELEMNMGGPQYSQQQAPPNQTAPWPDSILPIDQTSFGNQNR